MDRSLHQEWWTAAELAAARLPDMPVGVHRCRTFIITQACTAPEKVRVRSGMGSARECHFSALPASAQAALPAAPWSFFSGVSAAARKEAERRRDAVLQVERLVEAGWARSDAVIRVSLEVGTCQKTVWNWLSFVRGLAETDWLPALAPRHRGRSPATCDPQVWRLFTSYIRAGDNGELAYRKLKRAARLNSWALPSLKMLQRRSAAFKRSSKAFLAAS